MIKVSVVIPSYNHGKFLKTAIKSVLNQTFEDFELIILDDASTDNSKNVIDSFDNKKIRKYFHKNNEGAVATLNQLIDLAKGRYIAILNSDDCWEMTKLEKQVKVLEENSEIGACFTWADFINEKDEILLDSKHNIFQEKNRSRGRWLRYFFDKGNCLCHPSVLIRKEIYEIIGKYNIIYRQLPDFEFWIRLIKQYNIHIIEENLTHFRILSGEQQNTSFLNEENLNLLVYENHMIKDHFFSNCNPRLFHEAFKDQIKNKKSFNNKILTSFEMAMIIYNSIHYPQIGRFVGYNKLGKILSNEHNLDLINSNYNFSISEYYKLGEKITKIDSVVIETQKVEVIPDFILNSRYFKLRNKIVKIIKK